MGYPNRISRAALGPDKIDPKPVRDVTRQVSAQELKLIYWQLTGLNRAAARVLVYATVSGGVVTVTEQYIAWDPNGALPLLTFGYSGVGVYTFAFPAAQYDDESGNDVTIVLRAGPAWTQDFDDTRAKVKMTANNAGTVKVWGPAVSTAVDKDFGFLLF
jgi:hypothetical protein